MDLTEGAELVTIIWHRDREPEERWSAERRDGTTGEWKHGNGATEDEAKAACAHEDG